jgi:uncharacterized protein with von Willebrand factor type A (vWA) domain
MFSLPLANPDQEAFSHSVHPAERFHQQVLADLALAELERQLQQLMRLMPRDESTRQRRSRRIRRVRVRRTVVGYPAL